MDRKKHRHVFMMRIEHRPGDEKHEEKYTAYYRVFFYDPDSRSAYLDFDDWCLPDKEDPFKVADNYYLFSPFSYPDPFTNEEIIRRSTHTLEYALPSDKEYDRPEGIKLCAELNLDAYEKTFKAWNHYKELNRTLPAHPRAIGIMNHYERVVADCRQWYGENCPEFLPKLASAPTDASANRPKEASMDKLPREFGDLPLPTDWSDLTITFDSHDTIQIRVVGHKPVTRHFASLAGRGFIDNRSGVLPNRLWEELQILASYEGVLKYDGPFLKFTPRRKTEQRISKLRMLLQEIFQLDEDPIKWKRGGGYRCSFHIGAEPEVLEMFSQRWSE